MDHRADLGKSSVHVDILNRNALLLSQALGEPVSVVQSHLSRLLQKHGVEWKNFVGSLGSSSFIAQWTQTAA
jgi:hypothetical protein